MFSDDDLWSVTDALGSGKLFARNRTDLSRVPKQTATVVQKSNERVRVVQLTPFTDDIYAFCHCKDNLTDLSNQESTVRRQEFAVRLDLEPLHADERII